MEDANVHFLDSYHEKTDTLVQTTIRRVESYIWGRKLKVGDVLPGEGRLADELGVSRNVMREAFGALTALGVIDVANGRRPRVGRITSLPFTVSVGHALHTGQVTFQQVWDVRRRLETGAAAAAAVSRTAEQAVHLMTIAQDMVECDNLGRDIGALDLAFHRILAEASGNVLVEHISTAFLPLLRSAIPLAWNTRTAAEDRAYILRLHMDIARAVVDRDAAGAEAAMHLHFDNSIAAIAGGIALLLEPGDLD